MIISKKVYQADLIAAEAKGRKEQEREIARLRESNDKDHKALQAEMKLNQKQFEQIKAVKTALDGSKGPVIGVKTIREALG